MHPGTGQGQLRNIILGQEDGESDGESELRQETISVQLLGLGTGRGCFPAVMALGASYRVGAGEPSGHSWARRAPSAVPPSRGALASPPPQFPLDSLTRNLFARSLRADSHQTPIDKTR